MTYEQAIEQLYALDLRLASEEDIISFLRKYGRAGGIIDHYHPAYGEDGVHNFFVRASNYDLKKEKITTTDRLRYPPIKYNIDYQRASTTSKTMFY